MLIWAHMYFNKDNIEKQNSIGIIYIFSWDIFMS